jgi:hypothetical protein
MARPQTCLRPLAPRNACPGPLHSFNRGEPVPRQNYHQVRKQKELARKTRQQEKQQRRSTPASAPGTDAAEPASQTPAASEPVSRSET